MTTFLPKGFKNLSVSATVVGALLVVPLGISILDWKQYFLFAWDPFISQWQQYWRLLIVQIQFQNQSEVTLAVVLFTMKLKGLERLYGSVKFAKSLILLYIYNILGISIVSFLAYYLLKWDLFIPAGPFGIIFALLYAYNVNTPVVYQVELNFNNVANLRPFGDTVSFNISNKMDTYILAFLLFFNEGLMASPLVCTIGYIIGYLYFNDILPITDTSLSLLDKLFSYGISESAYHRLSTENNNTGEGSEEDITEEDPSVPPRTLGQQFLDTFRR